MYSPVVLSRPTTSGSPPVLSISLSDHSFSASASSLACTFSHSRPLWRFMFCSKRACNALSSSSRCFFERVMFDIVLTLADPASQARVRTCGPRRSFPNKSSKDMAFPHPQSGKDHNRNKDIPSEGRVVRKFFKRTINITEYRNAEDEVNPAENRTFYASVRDVGCIG